MKFIPPVPYTFNRAENILMNALKEAFAYDRDSVTYSGLQPRKKNGSLDKESDLTILHPDIGLLVIECKGCEIGSIDGIEADVWHMKRGWYSNNIQPFKQAKEAMYTIRKVIQRFCKSELSSKDFIYITNTSLVALPLISEQEWQEKYRSHNLRSGLILKDDLEPARLKYKLENSLPKNLRKKPFGGTLLQWQKIIDFCGTNEIKTKIANKIKLEQSSPSTLKKAIQGEYFDFDETQIKIATAIPEGPQRLRGLAGTGKTLLLVKRAVKMHFKHPDWNIAFVFYSKSLYEQIKQLIKSDYLELRNLEGLELREPDWKKLQVMCAWGGKFTGNGFYFNLVSKCNFVPKTTDLPMDLTG